MREELFKGIKKIADDLRGAVDGWDFKHYVLGTLFYRYLSEFLADSVTKHEVKLGDTEFNYFNGTVEDGEDFEESNIKIYGFHIMPADLFGNVVANAPTNENLNVDLERIFKSIERSAIGSFAEDDFNGLFNEFDVKSPKLGNGAKAINKRLVKLLQGVANMNLGSFDNNDVDAFGDVYENLMSMYASEAGKSGGEFFTPQEVSELVAKIAIDKRERIMNVYDPTCGSGSLLLKFAKILGKDNIVNGFYGQEINITTYNLARMNMFLHGIKPYLFNIKHGDTLLDPKHLDVKPFEAIVSNPPYSVSWEGDDNPILINDSRFAPAGTLAPNSKADMAFVMHCLSHLDNKGTAAIVVFPGILYRNGREQQIRQYLVDNNFVDAVIELPSNIFYGTSITTDILVLKKGREREDVLFINASKEFISQPNNNKLSESNIENILRMFEDRQDVDHLVKVATKEDIASKGYDLSVGKYVEREDTSEVVDIKVLNDNITSVVELINVTRDSINEIVAEIEGSENE